jgi:DNA polymerase
MTYKLMFIDIESRSQIDLKKDGLARYARDPSTQVICVAYAIDDEPVQSWFANEGDPFPSEIIKHIKSGGLLMAWNSGFENTLFDFVISNDYDFTPPNANQWRCAMVASTTSGYPASLAGASHALNLPQQKMTEGTRLIRSYCAPGHQITWQGEDRLLMANYCETDVEVMRDAVKCFRQLTDDEWHEHTLNQEMNDRGIPVDVPFAEVALGKADELTAVANDEISKLTNGTMTKHTQRKSRDIFLDARLTSQQQGLLIDYKNDEKKKSLDQDHRSLLLECEDLNPDARQLLTLINEAGSSALRKYNVIVDQHVDGVVHDTLVFNGAQTGRFTSKGLQIHNIRRDCFEPDVAEQLISNAIAGRELDEPGQTLARLMRAAIKHDDGLYWVDYSGIEARVGPWLANDDDGERILDVHRRGDDLYVIAAAAMCNLDPSDVSKELRNAGKVGTLACGYGGGVYAFQQMAGNYGLTFTDDQAKKFVYNWRDTNPWAVNQWASFDEAITEAFCNPGESFSAGRCALHSDGEYIWCTLPSGRLLAYPKPDWETYETPWGEVREGVTHQAIKQRQAHQEAHEGRSGHAKFYSERSR